MAESLNRIKSVVQLCVFWRFSGVWIFLSSSCMLLILSWCCGIMLLLQRKWSCCKWLLSFFLHCCRMGVYDLIHSLELWLIVYCVWISVFVCGYWMWEILWLYYAPSMLCFGMCWSFIWIFIQHFYCFLFKADIFHTFLKYHIE